MKINNIAYVARHAKPSTLQRVGLEAYFINDGVYQDPYEISSVSIFRKLSNLTPSTVLDASTGLVSTVPLMYFANSASLTSNAIFDTSNYAVGNTASGIFKLADGKYIVLLDGTVALSAQYTDDSTIKNGASAIGTYIDVWTVTHVEGSLPQVVIHEFELYQDTFISISEPLIFTPNVKLKQKKIPFGSIVDLVFTCEFTVDNRNIAQEVKNLFKASIITDPKVLIQKINQDTNTLSPTVVVSSFADTSGLIEVTSDDTILLRWDTTEIPNNAAFTAGTFGPIKGHYQLLVEYTVLNQTFRTEYFNLVLT